MKSRLLNSLFSPLVTMTAIFFISFVTSFFSPLLAYFFSPFLLALTFPAAAVEVPAGTALSPLRVPEVMADPHSFPMARDPNMSVPVPAPVSVDPHVAMPRRWYTLIPYWGRLANDDIDIGSGEGLSRHEGRRTDRQRHSKTQN